MDTLKTYLENIGYETDLFDVGLHFNFHKASVEKENYDLTTILDNSVMLMDPIKAVTFVDNHDSQKGSALESEIESWFIPHAYAIILLSEKGYPCLFYGDYYGVGDNKSPHGWVIDKLLYVRRNNAYGEQINYFDDPNIIAFYRKGRENEINTGCVAILSNNEDGEKAIEIGKDRIGQVWEEVTGSGFEDVVIDEEGNAAFRVEGQKIAVWVPKKQ